MANISVGGVTYTFGSEEALHDLLCKRCLGSWEDDGDENTGGGVWIKLANTVYAFSCEDVVSEFLEEYCLYSS